MPAELVWEGHAPSPCTAYRHHVHTELTRAPRRPDPRVPGRSRHDAVSVTRHPDHLSPHLFHACATGAALGTVTLRVWTEDDDQDARPWFRIVLCDVLVTSVLSTLDTSGPLETVTLDYGGVRWVHEGDGDPSDLGWNVLGASEG